MSAGSVNTAGTLDNQSTYAFWWTSSLSSATNAYRTYVTSTGVNPGTGSFNRAGGFSVRCVFP
ncbi:fibrobacter succinogenes major paralogous domain-containing protein [Candidatus Saccharibacteria bacterium]|nr:fibrobacter succinogenes major paralogous domain-containing protein [Candidatus Saccharibacteria bacterium]